MKTLIVHPRDKSTSFLEILYRPIKNTTIVTDGINKVDLIKLITSHDRVMMMGHGSPHGLFSVGQFKETNGFIIDQSMVPYLKGKKENVYIWCNADQFIERHNLKGFYSGMFISEVGEAFFCGLKDTEQKVVDESNLNFCKIMSEYINEDVKTIYNNVMKDYGLLAEVNKVADYNHQRLYIS